MRKIGSGCVTLLLILAGLGTLRPTLAQPTGAGQKMLVLSYNICWQCMTNTSAGSAPILGSMCRWDPSRAQTTVCAEQMGALIERTPSDYAVENYDFVAIQEGSNWTALKNAAPKSLGKMQAVPRRVGQEWSVVFFDDAKYALTHEFGGDSGHGYAFQVLIFDAAGLIFVNVHNCHQSQGCSMSTLEQELSSGLLALGLDHQERLKLQSYRMVVAGDFNEAGHLDPQGKLSFAAFSHAGIPTESSLQNPPMTCCSQNTPWQGFRAGDFIFDSKSVAAPEVPRAYDRSVIRSDHLPVVAVLPAQ